MTRHLSIYSLSSFMILHFPCIRPKCNCMSNFDLTFCPQILQLVGFPVLIPVCVFWTCKNTLSSIPFLKQILQQNSGFFFDPICNWTPVIICLCISSVKIWLQIWNQQGVFVCGFQSWPQRMSEIYTFHICILYLSVYPCGW